MVLATRSTIEFIVTNTGNVTLGAVAVDDPLAGVVTCPASHTRPGGSDDVQCDL